MTTMTLNETVLAGLRERRKAGESLKTLAGESGLPWQRLDKAIRNGLPKAHRTLSEAVEVIPPIPIPPVPDNAPDRRRIKVVLTGDKKIGALTQRYRPQTLAALVGQEKAVKSLGKFLTHPYPCAFLFEGETGTGKTSAAVALAKELGCAVQHEAFGGLHVLSSGDQTAEAIRSICEMIHQTPFCGSGWKVVVVNECDRMHVQAETLWLDRLEALPEKTVVIFTTNHPQNLSPRFRDRCLRVRFESASKRLITPARHLLTAMWKAETGQAADMVLIDGMVRDAVENQKLSLRRAVQLLQIHLLAEGTAGKKPGNPHRISKRRQRPKTPSLT